MVASFLHRCRHRSRCVLSSAAADDHHVLDRRSVVQCLVGHLLERHDLSAPVTAVGGDEEPCLLIVDAIAERLGAEAAEDDAVNGADARTRQHRNRQLGNQRQVERDAIALCDSERFQNVRELRHLAVQVVIGERPRVARLAFPDDRGLVPSRAAAGDGRCN